MIYINTEWKKVRSKVLEDFSKLIDLFKTEDKWCRGAMARTWEGDPLPNPYESEACKWCLMGAVYKLEVSNVTIGILNKCARANFYSDIVDLNDKTSYNDVKTFLINVQKSVRKIK